jgi:hypothetical protein
MGSLTETSFNQQTTEIKYKEAHWIYHIEQWQLSDLTQAVYCQQQGLSLDLSAGFDPALLKEVLQVFRLTYYKYLHCPQTTFNSVAC